MKVAFDIGGLISRYPEQMQLLMTALIDGGVEVCIVTDMNNRDAIAACQENGLTGFVGTLDSTNWTAFVLSADWSTHGDLCKSRLMAEHGIDILIDDRPDYCASGDFIGLVLSPRPSVPYYAPGWVNRSTPAMCVPPEEYEAFRQWRDSQKAPPAPRGLGETLKAKRSELGLALRKMAVRTGLSNSYLSQIETGAVTNPTACAIKKISTGYGIPIDQIVKLCGSMKG